VQAQAEACGYRLTSFPRTPDRRLGIDPGGSFTDLVFLGAGEGRVHMPFYYGPDLEGGFAFHGPGPEEQNKKLNSGIILDNCSYNNKLSHQGPTFQ